MRLTEKEESQAMMIVESTYFSEAERKLAQILLDLHYGGCSYKQNGPQCMGNIKSILNIKS